MGLSVVIPAFDEAGVIGDCLESLSEQSFAGEVQVIVVANGCSDDTASRAARYRPRLARRGYELVVIEQQSPSKPEALNRGDDGASFADRIYLDADVTLSRGVLASISAAFDRGVLFCAPRIESRSEGHLSEAYRQVWTRLPYVANDVVGAGLYAVSGAGRARWTTFPDIVADDKFARLHFERSEREVLNDSCFVVFMPSGLADLVRVRSRWIRANRQLRRTFPVIAQQEPKRLAGMPAFPLRHPRVWRYLPSFLFIYTCAEIRSRTTDVGAGLGPWERSVRARRGRQPVPHSPERVA